MSLKGQAVKGVMWNAIERFSTQGIQFILTIIIARLLSPDDYGLIAMLGIFMAIAQTFIDSGFANALIQKQDRTEADYSTAFYFNIIVAVAFYLLFFFLAPWIASFYEQPELVMISRVFFLSLIINSLSSIQIVRFTVTLDFKKIACSSLASVLFGGIVGFVMANRGWGAWAIVGQSLAASIVGNVVLWKISHWIPCLQFSKSSFYLLSRFGFKLLGSNLLHTLYSHMYSLVIGKMFGAVDLGYYNRSYTLGQFPVQNFAHVVQKVMYPIQCRYQNDKEQFNGIFTAYLRLSSFVMFPIMIGMAVLASPMISLLLTERWLPAVPFLQIIAVSVMWLPIMQANVSVLDAKGRTDYHLRAEIIKKTLALLILCITIPMGIYWLCWGLLVYAMVDMIVVIAYSRRLTGIGYKEQFLILAPVTIISLIMGGFVAAVACCIEQSWLKLFVGVIVGMIVYIALACLFRLKSKSIFFSFIKKKISIADVR